MERKVGDEADRRAARSASFADFAPGDALAAGEPSVAAKPARAGRTPRAGLLARALDAPDSLPGALLASLAGHLLLVAVAMGLSVFAPAPPPPRQVLLTRLVRLGPPRPKEQLPQLDASPKAAAVRGPEAPKVPVKKTESKAAAASDAAAAQQAQAQAQSRAQARQALARLKREAAGATDGDVAGDTDVAQEGDRYMAEVKRCLQDNYVIEGLDTGRLRGLRAVVVVRIQADGRIISHRIAESPGVAAFEQAIARAVRGCNKVSPPPRALQKELRQEGVAIDFTP